MDDFGDALLRGMGATDEQLEGRDGVYEADAPRASKGEFLGLGADRDPRAVAEAEAKTKRRQRNAHAAAADHEREAASAARRQRFAWLSPGVVVRMVAGPYRQQLALVQQSDGVPGMDRMRVRLERAGCRVVRKVDADTAARGEEGPDAAGAQALREEEAGARRAEAEEKREEAAKRRERAAAAAEEEEGRRKRGREGDDGGGGKRARGAEEAAPVAVGWLMAGVRVRFADESFEGGRLYRLKGVVRKAAGGTADVVAASGELVAGVPGSGLQTALPKAGGDVVFVAGPRRGRRGQLLSRSSATGTGRVSVRGETAEVRLDAIAEWVGAA